jgi:hypothetical protein
MDGPIFARLKSDISPTIDRHREHKTIVIVRVFSNQVHTTRRADDNGRRAAEPARELVQHTLAQTNIRFRVYHHGHVLSPVVPGLFTNSLSICSNVRPLVSGNFFQMKTNPSTQMTA